MRKNNESQKNMGFTLIEVMIVVVIISILAAIIVPSVMKRPDQARIIAAHQDIMSIQSALDLYKIDNGMYPSQNQGIDALVVLPKTNPMPQHYIKGGYLKKKPIDPWGHSYQYHNPGEHDEIDIFSYGPSAILDESHTEDLIGNWDD